MKVIYILSIAMCSSCIGTQHLQQTSGLTEAITREIPVNANTVTVTQSQTTPYQLYEYLIQTAISRGHRIDHEDKERYYFTTQGKDVGNSTLQRMTVSVMKISESVSEATINTEWMGGTFVNSMYSGMMGASVDQEWETAYWMKGRPGIAFAESVSVAWKIPRGKVNYR